jgi:hypothetical protein
MFSTPYGSGQKKFILQKDPFFENAGELRIIILRRKGEVKRETSYNSTQTHTH